jgi:hypothetical protein
MMDRRAFIAGSAILILAPGAVAAQPERIWRIGYLSEGSVEKSRMAAFRQGLRELGYVERQNLIIEERYARQQVEKLPALAADPGELPIEHPTNFDLVVNLRTAKGLGLSIPPSVLLRADRVIE